MTPRNQDDRVPVHDPTGVHNIAAGHPVDGRQRVSPAVFARGWRAALSGIERAACPHPDGSLRDAWLEGYADAERERAKDVADVREAVRRNAR